MKRATDLQLLEKTAFRKFYDDGLFDVFLGLMMALMALAAAATNWLGSETFGLLVTVGASLILVIVLMVARRNLLRSRLGEFVPGPARRRKIRSVRLALLASMLAGVVAFGVAVVVYRGGVSVASLEFFMPMAWFVNATVVFGMMAHLLDVPRFYLYGPLFGVAMPLLIWPETLWDVRVPPWVAFGIPASIIVSIGVRRLLRFLKDYPEQPPADPEPTHDG